MAHQYSATVSILLALTSPAFGREQNINVAVWIFKLSGQAFVVGMILSVFVVAFYVVGMTFMLAYYATKRERGTQKYRSLVDTCVFCLKVVGVPVALGAGSGTLFYLLAP